MIIVGKFSITHMTSFEFEILIKKAGKLDYIASKGKSGFSCGTLPPV